MSRAAALAVVLLTVLAAPAAAHGKLRPIPDTRDGVHVFNDQYSLPLTDAQVRFLARHNDGTQKIPRHEAARLRRVNPGFLALHYRLGIGSGPVPFPFLICNRWTSDFDRTVTRRDGWFWRIGGRRVLHTVWNWWVMNPDTGWRRYWVSRVRREVACNGSDGVFADSTSVPHRLGADQFRPAFTYFEGEREWERRITSFLRYARQGLRGRAWVIPNAGSWVTTRDRTDYAGADGVMIEGFAFSSADAPYALPDCCARRAGPTCGATRAARPSRTPRRRPCATPSAASAGSCARAVAATCRPTRT